ncbi:MAG: chromophore lyase CpcT/CpeT [Planctomycetota bacterium]
MTAAVGFAAVFLLAATGCGSDGVIARTADSVSRAVTGAASEQDAARVAGWLVGSFSSAEQAASSGEHFEVVLHHARIWDERDDGIWLYVEQALAASTTEPYRQRVYRVWLRPDGVLESAVYELPDPLAYVGAWQQPGRLAALSPISLSKREGCAVVFGTITDELAEGSTNGTGCGSTLRGAAYATSVVTVTPNTITSWDRGFDAEGNQVWGAESEPYEFRRVADRSD